jgi:glutamate racemase
MKIGIFDSGLGGLIIAKAIKKHLSHYDYVYYGDTLNLPYGEKSKTQIYQFTKRGVEFLFKQNCSLVILACNTASALALRKIQQEFLPKNYPDRRVLGVVIPTLEKADKNLKNKSIGVIATKATVDSKIYSKELTKIDSKTKIYEIATPELVTDIENDRVDKATKNLVGYLNILTKHKICAIILGCTHYPILKQKIRQNIGKNVKIISQDEIIPKKLTNYLKRHKEIAEKLSKNGKSEFFVSKQNEHFNVVAKRLFGKKLNFQLVK